MKQKHEYCPGQYSQAVCSIIRIEQSCLGYRSKGSVRFPDVPTKIAHYGKTGNCLARVVQVLKVPPLGDMQRWSTGGGGTIEPISFQAEEPSGWHEYGSEVVERRSLSNHLQRYRSVGAKNEKNAGS